LLLLNKSRPSPASRPPRFRCVFSAARSFFLFNDTDLIVGVFFFLTERAFDDDANFLPYLILQKRIDVCDDARERSDLRCALLVSPRERTKTNARNNASSRRCVVRSLEVDPQRIDFEISLNFEKKIFSFESRRERKKIFDFRFDFITHDEWLVRRETDLFFSLKLFFIYYYQSKSISKVVKADIYPEFGTYPGGGESPIIPFGDEKNAEREIIHGRWAQLGVTGAWAAENGTGIPWFTAGTLCTPDDCTAVADKFPGAVAPLAPEGSGYPSFWNVLIIETVLVGAAEGYRTGLIDPVFDELSVGDVSPGGRFDPLGLAESGDLEELKIKELKHCRLSMFAWLGCIFQALATQEGPIANWQAHTADPVHANVLTNAAKGFGFY
jgi:hypothetical protein